MGKQTKKSNKVVKITETALVDMIEGIVTEAVNQKKKQWIAEQKSKNDSVIEEQVDRILESKLKKIFTSK